MNMAAWLPGTKSWRRRRQYILCRQTIERVQEIVDNELPHGHTARTLERHLMICKSCGHEAEAIRTLKIAIQRVGRDCDPEAVTKLEELARRLCDGTHSD